MAVSKTVVRANVPRVRIPLSPPVLYLWASTKLVSNSGKYDLIYVDVTGEPYSTIGNGGFVEMVRSGLNNYTVMAGYEGDTFELYSFVKERDGAMKMHVLSSKGGMGQINKSTVMVGRCDYVKF